MNNSVHFQGVIGYRFQDIDLLKRALTHSSYVKETGQNRLNDNERLEFLGDAFFDAIIGEALYRKLPQAEEGRLSKVRAAIVCEASLAAVGRSFDIGNYMQLSRGEDKSGGRERDSIIADAMEAIIGAIYLDGGYQAVQDFVLRAFEKNLRNAVQGKLTITDYKSELQELLQAKGILDISYLLDKEDGPDHNKTFSVRLEVCGKIVGRGQGKSKKTAEQNAAKDAIEGGMDVL